MANTTSHVTILRDTVKRLYNDSQGNKIKCGYLYGGGNCVTFGIFGTNSTVQNRSVQYWDAMNCS